jgi:hypothetical protein
LLKSVASNCPVAQRVVLILPLGFPEVPEEIYLNPDSACDTSGALSGNGSPGFHHG